MRIPHLLYSLGSIYVASLEYSNGGSSSISLYEVFRQKGELHLRRLDGAGDIPKNAPLVILAYGSGVITKITPSHEMPFEELIPQHRQSEFTHSTSALGEVKVSCFAQNSLFDETTSLLSQVNIIRVGFAATEGLNGLQLIPQEQASLVLPGIAIQVQHGASSVAPSAGVAAQPFFGEPYTPAELAALLAGTSLLSHRTTLKLRYPDTFEYFTLKRSLYRIYGGVLAAVFMVLLLNYLLLSSLQGQHPMIESEISSMHLRIAAAKVQVKALGITQSSEGSGNLAILSDRLGVITPSGIMLTKATFNPITGQVEAGDITAIEQKGAEISGTAHASSEVNALLVRLRFEKWVASSTLSDLSFSTEKAIYRFTIAVKIK